VPRSRLRSSRHHGGPPFGRLAGFAGVQEFTRERRSIAIRQHITPVRVRHRQHSGDQDRSTDWADICRCWKSASVRIRAPVHLGGQRVCPRLPFKPGRARGRAHPGRFGAGRPPSSGDVHPQTLTPSLISVISARFSLPRSRSTATRDRAGSWLDRAGPAAASARGPAGVRDADRACQRSPGVAVPGKQGCDDEAASAHVVSSSCANVLADDSFGRADWLRLRG
jgi:hypothetical protein